MTASKLHNLLISAGVVMDVHEGNLRVSKNVPANLRPKLAILQTGIRAILTGSAWYGFRSATASWRDGLDNPLDPKKPLPIGIDRLCVEGDSSWDCLPASLIADHSTLWQAAKKAKAAA